MRFLVEDGTGLLTSTSYISVDYFTSYWEDLGVIITDPYDTICAWLNEGTRYIDLNYLFQSCKSTEDQALEFPRSFWGTEIPIELKKALCEIAYARKAKDPSSSVTQGISSESYGPVSVSYKYTGKTFYKTADMIINSLIYRKTRRIIVS